MSVLRVITRIIPLNASDDASFQPVPINILTDGIPKEIKVLDLIEPQSGVNYRIERFEDVQNVGPGETIESINKAFAEKLESIPGFEQLKASGTQSGSYDKSFQFTLPQVISLKGKDVPSNNVTISVVKNRKFIKKPLKILKCSEIPKKNERSKIRIGKTSKMLLKAKCRVRKMKKKLKFKNKKSVFNQSPDCTISKSSAKDIPLEQSSEMSTSLDTQDKDSDPGHIAQKCEYFANSHKNNCPIERFESEASEEHVEIAVQDKAKEDLDDPFDLECGELVINVPEAIDSNSNSQLIADISVKNCNKSNSNDASNQSVIKKSGENSSSPKTLNFTTDKSIDSNTGDKSVDSDSCAGDQADFCQISDVQSLSNLMVENTFYDQICCKYIVPVDHPLHDLLQSLKKYFVNGECLICGFISIDIDYNASEHMESHISSNSSLSCYKCVCCNEKFCSPRSLYKHALSREKNYSYMCEICLLKFKRKHYLMRHNAKAHLDKNW